MVFQKGRIRAPQGRKRFRPVCARTGMRLVSGPLTSLTIYGYLLGLWEACGPQQKGVRAPTGAPHSNETKVLKGVALFEALLLYFSLDENTLTSLKTEQMPC